MIYLVKTEVREGTFFKVGYTSNLAKRLIPYFTHNPNIELLETIKTYKKTKYNLETEIHEEIVKMGYNFKLQSGFSYQKQKKKNLKKKDLHSLRLVKIE